MKIDEIAKLLNATIHYMPEGYDKEITHAGASDLMSDVLAYVVQDILLITGLLGPQVIRTASMMDISAVIFTRGKVPTQDVINLAKDFQIGVLSTELKSYTTCGRLYCSGIRSIDEDLFQQEGRVRA